ncbi:hypothetical protein M9458_041092, partial [Cirrhinus mrigala]
ALVGAGDSRGGEHPERRADHSQPDGAHPTRGLRGATDAHHTLRRGRFDHQDRHVQR